MAKRLIVETFDCPYGTCVWPRCKTDMTECINHPLCGSAIEATKMRIVQRYAIKPRPKRRRRTSAPGRRRPWRLTDEPDGTVGVRR